MDCPNKDRLFREYREAASGLVASVAKLKDGHSQALLKEIGKSRTAMLLAKEQYRQHIRLHECEKLISDITTADLIGI